VTAQPGQYVHLDYPFAFDAFGRTARTSGADHVRDMIEQVLFTIPGERVNRPEFGTGVMQLVFAPNSPQLASTVEYLVQGALAHWLSDVITVDRVEVVSLESSLQVAVDYTLQADGEPGSVVVEREVGS